MLPMVALRFSRAMPVSVLTVSHGMKSASCFRFQSQSRRWLALNRPLAACTSLIPSSGRPSGSPVDGRRCAAVGASGRPPTPRFDQSALEGLDVFIFDCDGVLWRGDCLIDGAPHVLTSLRARGKKLLFVTNNATKSRKGYKSKFDSLGLPVASEDIFSSSFAAAVYLEQIGFRDTGKKAYVIGERGITEELDLIGVPWIGAETFKNCKPPIYKGGKVDHDPDVGVVIVGFDRHINYYKLQYAQLCLNNNPGCMFVATNLDRGAHFTDAQMWASNGTMVGAVQGCTGLDPILVGKPSPLMIEHIESQFSIVDRRRICMVGDRLDTDILFARSNGLQSCLTLSGVTSRAEMLHEVPRKKGTEDIDPDFFVDTVSGLIA